MSAKSPVHFSASPPDGFESWDAAAWERWLSETPPEPAQVVASRAEWQVFLFVARAHASEAMPQLAPFLERLQQERPIPSGQVSDLLAAFDAVAAALARVPAARLWTGPQFLPAHELHDRIVAAEVRTGREGMSLRSVDLWHDLFERVDVVLTRAIAHGRGVYFGHV